MVSVETYEHLAFLEPTHKAHTADRLVVLPSPRKLHLKKRTTIAIYISFL